MFPKPFAMPSDLITCSVCNNKVGVVPGHLGIDRHFMGGYKAQRRPSWGLSVNLEATAWLGGGSCTPETCRQQVGSEVSMLIRGLWDQTFRMSPW